MTVLITRKDAALIVGAVLSLLAAAVVEEYLLGRSSLILVVVLATALVLWCLLEAFRRVNDECRRLSAAFLGAQQTDGLRRLQDFRQVESLLSLFHTLKPDRPLPESRGWAASPDLLKRLSEVVLREKPRLVVEAGSGLSTLVMAYCLRRLGSGRIVALEHEPSCAAASRELLVSHGLSDVATIVCAPLRKVDLEGQSWLWYDLQDVCFPEPIDLLFIDGPPGVVQSLARFPALPILYPHLASAATVILDDGLRADERAIVALWAKEYPEFVLSYLEFEKGAFLLERGDGR